MVLEPPRFGSGLWARMKKEMADRWTFQTGKEDVKGPSMVSILLHPNIQYRAHRDIYTWQYTVTCQDICDICNQDAFSELLRTRFHLQYFSQL